MYIFVFINVCKCMLIDINVYSVIFSCMPLYHVLLMYITLDGFKLVIFIYINWQPFITLSMSLYPFLVIIHVYQCIFMCSIKFIYMYSIWYSLILIYITLILVYYNRPEHQSKSFWLGCKSQWGCWYLEPGRFTSILIAIT